MNDALVRRGFGSTEGSYGRTERRDNTVYKAKRKLTLETLLWWPQQANAGGRNTAVFYALLGSRMKFCTFYKNKQEEKEEEGNESNYHSLSSWSVPEHGPCITLSMNVLLLFYCCLLDYHKHSDFQLPFMISQSLQIRNRGTMGVNSPFRVSQVEITFQWVEVSSEACGSLPVHAIVGKTQLLASVSLRSLHLYH